MPARTPAGTALCLLFLSLYSLSLLSLFLRAWWPNTLTSSRGASLLLKGASWTHATSATVPLTPRPLISVKLATAATPVAYKGWLQYGHM